MTSTTDSAGSFTGIRRLRSAIGAALEFGLDTVLPPQCASCGVTVARAAALCPVCWGAVDFITKPYCERLGIPFAFERGDGALSAAAMRDDVPFSHARAVAHHRGPARDLVLALKFGNRVDLAPMMGAWMARAAADIAGDCDLVVPVPLHWLRRVRRRHNQAALLAGRVAEGLDLPVVLDALRRSRGTPPQTGLSARARERNVAAAFIVSRTHKSRLRDRRVLLIDDVMTTGATAGACARVLSRAGAAQVRVLTFTRVADEGADPI